MTLIKICGLTRLEDAQLAESLGADFLGVILAGGPRNLSTDVAAHVLGPRRHTLRRVAVFGTQSPTEIVSVARDLALDVVQLHGDPSVGDVHYIREHLDCAVWPVLRVDGTVLPDSSSELGGAAGSLVLDAKVVGRLGGTGTALDWASLQYAVRALRQRVPMLQLVLAGGLKATNVAEAIALLDPDVVDVSSGVELTPGVKDPAALEAFVKAVRATHREQQERGQRDE